MGQREEEEEEEDGTGASRGRPNGKWRKIEGNRFEGIFHEWIDGFRFFIMLNKGHCWKRL